MESVMEAEEAKNADDLKCMTQCSVCRETFTDPRVLPCLHTFCLHCIQQTGWNKRPGEKMTCPLCRKEFAIPEDDFDGLQKDFRIQSLFEMTRLSLRCRQSVSTAADHDGQEVYCYDCESVFSIQTYFDRHRSHDCSHILKAVEQFRNRLKIDEEAAMDWEKEITCRSHQMEIEHDSFLRQLSRMERLVVRRGEELHRLVDAHLDALMTELKLLKQLRLEEIETEKDAIDRHLLQIRRYTARCQSLRSMDDRKSLASDICRQIFDLQTDLQRLKVKHETKCIDWKPRCLDIKLKMTQLEEFITNSKNNIVGTVEIKRKSTSSIRTTAAVAMAVIVGAIWRILRLFDFRIQVSGSCGLLTLLLVALSVGVIAGAIAGIVTSYLLFALMNTLVPKTMCLQFLGSVKTNSRLASAVAYAPNRIFVVVQSPVAILLHQSHPPHARLKEISCPEVALPCDMASCHLSSCLYVTDAVNRCVWRVSLDDDQVTCWLTNMHSPHTISVSSDGRTVFVQDSHLLSSLDVYGLDGVMVERIRIPAKVSQPHHAVETSTGTYLISHGSWISHTHGLVELTSDAEIIRSYDSTESFWGSVKAISLLLDKTMHQDDARHLAIDADDRVFMADWSNDRIIRFDSSLKPSGAFVMSKCRGGSSWPILTLCFVKESKQMMIIHQTTNENRVHVYQMY